jgi:hypothetical protein
MSTETRDSTWSYRISLLLGSMTLLLDAVVMMWWGELGFNLFMGLLVGLFCLAISFWHFIGAAKGSRDERTLRVGTFATTLAWFSSVAIMVCGMITAYYLQIEYNGAQAMGFGLFTSVLSMLVWLIYYSTKSDIDLPGIA